MIDHILGRPSPYWKRAQVFLVIFFWLWRIFNGNPDGPRILWLRRANRLLKKFTPWQLVVSTLTGVYAVRHLDRILGLGSPEPLAHLYSANYYRATWISTGLDAGFATAMSIRPKWLRDFCSVLFSVYYIIYANEADEKLRRFRAVPTVEMLRTTWEKTTNPYLRAFMRMPRVTIRRKIVLPRPADSTYTRPVTAWLFFAPPEHHLARATELILDFPGGGFVSMTPEHHEERLRMWAVRTGKPVLSIEYGKAPEYPYPYAIDECFDTYRVLVESSGKLVGMSGSKFSSVLTGDSAGAHIAVAVMLKVLETQFELPHPRALVLNYAALDFNFTSWMSHDHLRVLQSEQSSGHLQGLVEQKDHFGHISPLSMVGDRRPIRRRRSWRDAIRTLTSPSAERAPHMRTRNSTTAIRQARNAKVTNGEGSYFEAASQRAADEGGNLADVEDDSGLAPLKEEEKPIQARVRFNPSVDRVELEKPPREAEGANPNQSQQAPLGTRLTMTSRTGYFQDRIISPSMMRAMAILYIGPHRNPDFSTDYYLSPILAPSRLLAHFPPLRMSCGEKDPFVDDTVIFAGRVREAKRARLHELDEALSGAGSRAPEPLRMTARDVGVDVEALRRERDRLAAQCDEDWVQMQIFTDWSHGYLQMPALMPAVRTVINDLADWIDAVFLRKDDANGAGRRRPSPGHLRRLVVPPDVGGIDDSSTPFTSETETESELTFVPKKRSPPPSFDDPALKEKALAAADAKVGGRRTSPNGHARPSLADRSGNGDANTNGHALGRQQKSPSPVRVGNGRAGQTITESELMRRRRLLDSHLISSTDAVK
ncbi:alpha/beta-hydrolase [Obba rivulosa]|uniref:Alpha/beta-hydrolase n=1 Tax=Obba rivulosa TaxID=1052685 RepID=A0A8E2DSS7_9APHY|nr:alpha/beta-hydrolase [Obba rivulosa]